MQAALAEMDRRRGTQERYNQEHGITPRSIVKSVDEIRFTTRVADAREDPVPRAEAVSLLGKAAGDWSGLDQAQRDALVGRLEDEMRRAADDLDFELAAQIRDQIMDLKAAGTGARGHGSTHGGAEAQGRGKARGRPARR